MSERRSSRGLDETGKIVLNDIYNARDPRSYYFTLGRLDYVIPVAARAAFIAIIDALRSMRGLPRVKIVDIGCSYGVNAAILKYDFGFAELVARYAAKQAEGLAGAALQDDDHVLFGSLEEARPIDVVGLDAATRAVAYAHSACIIDAGLARDFEKSPLDDAARSVLHEAHLVISTGAVGYVGAPTFSKVIEAAGESPWVAAFVLRQFDFAPIAAELKRRGYGAETLPGVVFPQRRFASDDERDGAMARLASLGRERTALEEQGWYASTLHVARPYEEIERAPLASLFERVPLPAAAELKSSQRCA
jgi:hypothetical protein